MALSDLPQTKWGDGTGRQVILKSDFDKTQRAILEPLPRASLPRLVFVDASTIRVEASADCLAALQMTGIPNIINPAVCVHGGLSDEKYRSNTANAVMNFATGDLYGTEKASQFYALLASAGAADAGFTLKAMPWLLAKSQTTQTISLGANLAPSTGIGYGFTTDQWIGSKIYFMTGASKGLMRTINANNNDNGTGGTITYSDAALTISQGDWFIILPGMISGVANNFRWLGDFFNNASSNVELRYNLIGHSPGKITFTANDYFICPFNKTEIYETACAGGGVGVADSVGNSGETVINHKLTPTPGAVYPVTIGIGGTGSPGTGGTTSLGALLSLAGGTIGKQINDYNNDPQTYAFFSGGLGPNYGRGGIETADGKPGKMVLEWL